MLVQHEVQHSMVKSNVTVGVVVLDVDSGKEEYNYVVLGKTLAEWTANACADYPVSHVKYDTKQDMLQFISSHKGSTTYTLYISSNMPLLTRNNINALVEYAVIKQTKLCKFTGGYIARNDVLKSNMYPDSVYTFDMDNFYIVQNKRDLSRVAKVLQERILNYHINNGVNIVSDKGLIIEPDVEIAEGVIVYAGNVLKGNTTIDSGVILKENNVLENCTVHTGACISGSTIAGSVVGRDTYILPYCHVSHSTIGDNCTLRSGTEVVDTIVPSGSTVGAK